MKRAIIGIGKQDTDLGSMTPCDPQVEIMGGSSDPYHPRCDPL